jgi:hypothetical protein
MLYSQDNECRIRQAALYQVGVKKVISLRSGGADGGSPQPFQLPIPAMQEIQSWSAAGSILQMSSLWLVRGLTRFVRVRL